MNERLDNLRGPVPALPLPHDHELRGRLPEGLNPPGAIGRIKELMVKRAV
jgi:hypothetical protein